MNNLLEKYHKEIVPTLQTEFNLRSTLAVPKVTKIVLNVGAGEALRNDKEKETILTELALIAGQKPTITKARKAIAGFKIRAGDPIGVKVTLRGKRMYDFLHKLIAIVFPRVRDFRGISTTSFDGNGGYSLGFNEQSVFQEIDVSRITKYRGLEITIATTGTNKEHTKRLLELFGMPFKKTEEVKKGRL